MYLTMYQRDASDSREILSNRRSLHCAPNQLWAPLIRGLFANREAKKMYIYDFCITYICKSIVVRIIYYVVTMLEEFS